MKRNIFFGLLITTCIISCQSKNNAENTVADTDSSMMAKDKTQAITTGDNASATTSAVAASDSNNKSIDSGSMQKVGMAKPDPSKKGKKGRVSISMNESASAGGSDAMDKEGYYTNVFPSYPGGQKALEKYFTDNLQYPAEATDNGVEGTVNISFAVDENGKVSNAKTTNNMLGYGLEDEALRVFKKMPTWKAGSLKGKNVKTRFSLPVRFELY